MHKQQVCAYKMFALTLKVRSISIVNEKNSRYR